jgi:GNAT superfamily N-acetyltransferase/8-oxo-dGTP pyrophosphatase MutT (NUDIX family)
MTDLSYYMEEGCGIFAVALCTFHPKGEIRIISDPEGEEWSESIPFEVSHVYCSTPYGNYDVKGKRTAQQMAADFNISNPEIMEPWSPQEFMKKFMGMGDKPLYGERADVEEAKQTILASSEKYGLPKTAAITPQDRILYHGTKKDFTELQPNEHGIVWLGEQDTAGDYSAQHYQKGESRVLKVEIAPNAKIVDLRDLSDPLIRELKDKISEWRKNTWGHPIPDEDWASGKMPWADFGVLEGGNLQWVIPYLKEHGVDGVIAGDVSNKGRKHDSLAVLNPEVIIKTAARVKTQKISLSQLRMNPHGLATARSKWFWAPDWRHTNTKPITVMPLPDGTFYVLDGNHRVVQAMKDGKTEISAAVRPYDEKRLQSEGEPSSWEKVAGWRDVYNERWIYHPNYGAFSERGKIGPHTGLIERTMGKSMSFGRNFDEVERGYAEVDPEDKTVTLGGRLESGFIDNAVVDLFKKKYPKFKVSIPEESITANKKFAATYSPLFHGTPNKFEVFRTRRTQIPGGGMSLGAYFTESPETAKKFMHGPNAVMKKVTLELNNPLDLRGAEYEQLPEILPWLNGSAKLLCGRSHAGMYQVLEYLNKYYKLVPELKKRGNDGIIFDDDVEGTTYVAFQPNQIEVIAGIEDKISVTSAPDGRITATHPDGYAVGVMEDQLGLANWLEDHHLQANETEKYAKSFILIHITVKVTARRTGLGRALTAALLDAAKAQGAQVCFLLAQSLVGVSQSELDAFYTNVGFQPIQRNVYMRKLAGQTKFAAMNTISLQDAQDRKLFGPVYHGTTEERQEQIGNEGFKIPIGEAYSEGVAHGYLDTGSKEGYHGGIPAPVHHLGFGVYFTTAKAIAKQFAGGTTRGMKTYYLDVPQLETINFGVPKTMMKWWVSQGYDGELAKKDRVAATKKLTEKLKSKWDAVWFKGKGMHRLLDGDQICVFDPARIYQVDPNLAKAGDVGSKVKRLADGMRGTIIRRDNIEGILEQYPAAASWVKPGAKWRYTIKWQKGGTDPNVQDVDLELVGAPKAQGATASKTAAGLPTYEQFVQESLNYNWEGKQHTAPMSSLLAELEYQDEAELKPAFEKMRAQLSAIKTPVTVYRKVYLENGIKDLRLNRIGGSWSDDEEHAQIVHGPVRAFKNENVWTLKASVPASSIDWQQTLWLRLTKAFGEKEREIRVVVGAPVTLLGYKKEGGEWEGHTQAVTAAAKLGWINEEGKKVKTNPKNKIRNLTFEVEDYAPAGYNEGYLVQAWTPTRLPNPYSPEERPVGQLDVIIDEFTASGKQPYVFDIGVEDDWRGTGLGQSLYDRAIAEAKKRGYTEFNSSTDRNPDSQAAWGRLSKRYPVEQKHDPKMKWETWDSIDLTASKIAAEQQPYRYVSVSGSSKKRQQYVVGFNPNLHTVGLGGIPTSGEMERISGPYKTVREAAKAAKAYSEQTGIPADSYVDFHSGRTAATGEPNLDALVFNPVDEGVWEIIQAEGLNDEQRAPERSQWLVAELPISDEDAVGLKNFADETVEKFNRFDIRLKEAFDGKLVDLIDYDKGVVKIVKTAAVDDGGFNEEGFWAGEGNAASGILPICTTTKRICLAWRSPEVHIGDCWGTIGGAVKPGMNPQESAKEEVKEETGFKGGITVHTAFVFQSGTFSYHNFLGTVGSEFSFHPQSDSHWETTGLEWFTLEQIYQMMEEDPNSFHPGVHALFQHSGKEIERLVDKGKKQASENDDVTTPLKVADPPDVIESFRYMRPFERDRLIEEAPLKEISPYELKTSQSAVSRHKVQWFMDHPEEIAKPRTDIGLSDTEQPYPLVLETNDGLWLYDGNHRSAAAYKLDLMIEAKIVDLRDYEEPKTAKVAKQYGPVYHGTYQEWSDKIQIDQYKIGKFFSSDPLVAQAYGSFVHECYLTMNKPLIVDAKGSGYFHIPTPKAMRGWVAEGMDKVDTDLICKFAYKKGYDGVIIKNVIELHHESLADDYVVFKPNQVKRKGVVEPEISPYTANKYHKQELQRRWERKYAPTTEITASSVEEDVADAKDWAERNRCQIEGNRARMWHGTPNETAATILKKGLRAGSKVATEAEEALFFAKRDRRRADGRLMTAKDITVLEVWLPFDSFYGTTWANLTRAVTPEETNMKVVKPIMKRAMAGWVGPVYHGTDKEFSKFEQHPGTRYILFKEFQVQAGGFFFTDEVEEAKKFGKNVMTCYLKMQKPLVKQEDQYGLSQKQAKDLTYICEPIMSDSYQDMHGNSVKTIELGAFAIDVDPEGAWLNEIVKQNGLDWNVLDNQEVVNRMKERGYDSTMVDEGDGQYSYFVISPDQIKIKQTKTAAKWWTGERWAYHSDYGVASSDAEAPHTTLIEETMGKHMSFGKNYDEMDRGYAFMDRKAKTIKLQSFQSSGNWVPEEPT